MKLEKMNIALSDSQRSTVIELLKTTLADQHVIYIKTRNYHWNLKGPRFQPLHGFFEELYTGLATAIDDTAERIRILGGVAPASMKEFLELTTLIESPGAIVDGSESLHALLEDHEAAVAHLRKAIAAAEECEDAGTADFLTGLIQSHEKDAWMLRSFLP